MSSEDSTEKLNYETRSGSSLLPPDVEHSMRQRDSDIGRFIKIKLLGKGGWGEVWLAWEKELRRYVAIKFVQCQTEEDRARVLREAQTSATLDHPNVVPVLEVVQDRFQPFIVMKYVNGETLDKAKLSLRESLEAAREIALAAHYAHGRGIIHRDIKPANIIVEQVPALRAYLMDFGLARQESVDTSISASGLIIGTPSFMPPEQARGKPKDVDARSDVYSIGTTLYFVLSGKNPFQGESPLEIVQNVLEVEPPQLHTIVPDFPTEVSLIVHKAMEKEKGRRYQSALAFAEDISRYLDGEPILAKAPTLTYIIKKKVMKNIAFYAAAACAVLIAIAAGTYFIADALARAKENELKLEEIETRASRLWADAENEFRKSEWGKAMEAVGKYLALRPNDMRAIELSSKCQKELDRQRTEAEQKKKLEEASRLCQQAIRDVAQARELLRVKTSKREQWERLYEQALAKTAAAIVLYPGSPEVFMTIGEVRQAQGEWKQADENFTSAIKLDANLSEAYYRRGLCFLELYGRALYSGGIESSTLKQQALDDLKKFSGMRTGSDTDLMYAKAALALIEARYAESAAICDEILNTTQTDEAVWLLKAKALHQNGEPEKALQTANMLIENVMPKHQQAYFLRGLAHHDLGHFEAALADFTTAIEIKPRDYTGYTNRGVVLSMMKRRDDAVKDFSTSIELNPDFAGAYMNRGVLYNELGKFDLAVRDLDRTALLDPRSCSTFLNRGIAKAGLGKRDEALADFRRAIELHPNDPDVHYQRGVFFVHIERFKEAIEDLTNCIKLNPNNPQAFASRGAARGNLRDFAGAIEDFTKAVGIEPDVSRYYAGRGIARGGRGEQLLAEGKKQSAVDELTAAKSDLETAIKLEPASASQLVPILDQMKEALEKLDKDF